LNTKRDNGIIRLDGVVKKFGKNLVLNGVNLEIKPGEILGIIGTNGSGKTTILKTIIGFYKPNKGIVNFKGHNIRKISEDMRLSFGFASQDNSFYGKLNVQENIKYFGELYGLTDEFIDTHMDNLLKLVDLYTAKRTLGENLSNGMKRRLDIACALIHDPVVLILDEPTQDLDPALRKDMLKLIKKINENGTTVIMTSHLLWEVEALCDRIAILAEGRILQIGTPSQLKQAYSKNDEIHLETYPGKYDKLLKGVRNLKRVVKNEHSVLLYTPDAEKVLHRILTNVERNKEKLIQVSVRKPSLDEVFSSILEKNATKV
jgi:ABC-2 type transport system ATP-binding protein